MRMQGQGGEGEALVVQRLRRTALGLADTYASYFTARLPDALLPLLQYVLGALVDPGPGICLAAALALRSLCDANRRARKRDRCLCGGACGPRWRAGLARCCRASRA
ncbi:hypothetical protein B0H13DRAFT_1128723 [Mycena leptocephala]|nr:hypothetical protein B0H13DRAFT_1128723 [Mycena leptocephala]